MPRSRFALASFLLPLLASLPLPGAHAQDEPAAPEPALPQVRYSLDEEGRILVRVGKSEETHPLIVSQDSLLGFGSLGIMALAYFGDTDLASLVDAPALFERMGRGADTDILRALARKAQPGDPSHEALLRNLAVRTAQQRNMKPAIGLLERMLGEDGIDESLREACENAIAALRGQPQPIRQRALLPIEQTLAAVPKDAQAVILVHTTKLPSGSILIPWARVLGEASMRQYVGMFGEDMEAPFVIAGMLSMSFASNMGYVLAHRFGNARVNRTVIALRFQEDFEDPPTIFVRVEGRWDLARIRAGLEQLGEECEVSDDEIVVPLSDGYRIVIREGVALCTHEDFAEPGGEAGAAKLSAHVGADASVAMWLSDTAPYPAEAGVFRISTATLTVPRSQRGHLRIHTEWATPAAAMAVLGWTGGLGRLVAGFADREERLIPVADAADALEVTRDGTAVDFDVTLPDTDLIALMRDVVVPLLFSVR